MVEKGVVTGVAGDPARKHLNYVEGMRAAAALVVYVNHAYAQCWNPLHFQAPTGPLSAFSYSLVAGHLSVTIFIVISGYCLTMPAVAAGDQLRGGAFAFFKRRARRILPPYYGALVLCLALIATVIGEPTGTFWDVPILVSRKSIVSHALLLQNFFATGSINYVFWSIAVEWQIYFLFPLLLLSWRRVGPLKTIAGAVVLGGLLRFGLGDTRIVRAHPYYVGMFALGMLAAYVVHSPRAPYPAMNEKFPWRAASAVGALVTVAFTLVWGIDKSIDRFYWLDHAVGVMAASMLVLASRSGSLLDRVFSWRPLVLIGTFSYSVYLVHAPLLQLFWQFVLEPLGASPSVMFGFFMTLGLGVILLASYGFFLVLEAPFLRKAASRRAEVLPAA